MTDLFKWNLRRYPAPCEMLLHRRTRLERTSESCATLASARRSFPLSYARMYRRRNIHNIQHASLNFRILFILFYINFSAFLFLINLSLHRLLVNMSAILFFSFYLYNIDNTFLVILIYIMTLYFTIPFLLL